MTAMELRIGVDVGGTFTDVVVETTAGCALGSFKLLSTPAAPDAAVLAALAIVRDRWGGADGTTVVCHGTTVGTNCLIERSGARMALIATKGFGDVLALRRQARPALFALRQEIAPPLVDAALRLELDERVTADGSVLKPIDRDELEGLVARLRDAGCAAVAVSLLHAYANPAHEIAVREAIERALPEVFITLSSEIAPEFREYERTSTAVVNSYIGPTVRNYIDRLAADMGGRGVGALTVIKSNGGLTVPALAARFPAHLLESGPAAGVVATAALAQMLGLANVLAFDVGGTTAKIALVRDGQPQMTREFHADRFVDGRDQGGYPVRSPAIELIEIGAGGGSIAWLDRAGVIRIGPRSAGATPGPACYGRGGTLPTVTDAHAVVGHLAAPFFAAAGIGFHPERARAAIEEHLGAPRGWSAARAAHAVLDLAAAKMAELVRLATVRRGIDPRDFVLVAYGGAGPLYAAEIARRVGLKGVVIPSAPGMFSAGGTLKAELRHDLVQTILRPLRQIAAESLHGNFRMMERRAAELMAAEPDRAARRVRLERAVEARFTGQLFELEIPLPDDVSPAAVEAGFRAAHRRSFGYDLPDAAVELVNMKLTVRAEPVSPAGQGRRAESGIEIPDHRTLLSDGTTSAEPIRARGGLPVGRAVAGPLLVADEGATARVPAGQAAVLDASGILWIEPAP